jgi:copper transport protein
MAAVIITAAAMPLFTTPAFAHASLIHSNPGNNETLRRQPLRVTLNFSEAIEQRLTSVQVIAGKDKKTRVDTNDLAFDSNDPAFASIGLKTLDPGLYFVKWSNVSAVDGHEYAGQYPFIILNADGTFPEGVSLDNNSSTSGGQLLPRNIDSALKWIALLSLATVAGAAFFLVAVQRPAAAFLEDTDYHAATDAAERWVVNLSHVLLPAAFIATAFLVLLTVNRFETSTSLWQYLTSVRTGQYRLAQLGLLAIALAGADLLFLGRTARIRNIGVAVLLVACLGTMFANSMISHAATGAGKFWSVSSDLLHLVASSAWLGALVMLLLFLLWRRRQRIAAADSADDEEAARFLYMANVLDRFSVVALISVVVILATGTFNGLADIPNAGAMIHTTYGKVLLAKISLLAPLLATAGLNALYFKPRLVTFVDGLYQRGGFASESQRGIWRRRLTSMQRLLPWTVAGEILLVLAVFGAVGVLTQTSTAKGEEDYRKSQTSAASKFEQVATQDNFKLTLQVSPNRVGINEYDLIIQNADGTPLSTVTLARLRFNYTDVPNAVAGSEVSLTRFATGEYKAAGSYFTQPGNWRVDVTVRRSDGDDVNHAYVLPVNPAQTTSTKKGSAFSLPFTVFTWNEVTGALLAIAGAVILFYRRQIGELRPWAYRAGVSVATVILLSAATLAFGVHSHSTAANPTKGNPVKATPDSIERGKQLFQQNCVQCHGITGSGDGPEAPNLNPAPTDFRLHMPLHTDPQFFAFITDGYAGSQMPAFRNAFSDTDIWNLVNYLRSAFTQAASQ